MKTKITSICLLLVSLAYGREQLKTQSTTLAEKLDSIVCYEANETSGEWEADYKYEFTSDHAGNITLETGFSMDESTGLWGIRSKEEYSYNSTGTLSEKISYDYDNNAYLPYDKKTYSYDGNNNMTQKISHSWNQSSNEWYEADPNDTTKYYYNNEGKLIEGDDYLYSYDNESHMTQSIRVDDMGENGVYYDTVNYEYNVSRDTVVYLQYDDKFISALDDNGNLITNVRYTSEDGNLLSLKSKMTYTYDISTEWSSLSLPPSWGYDDFVEQEVYFGVLNNKMTESTYFYWSEDKWNEEYKSVYFYSNPLATNIDNLSMLDVLVYPNPTTDFLHFTTNESLTTAEVEIFDLQSRKILSSRLHKNMISLSHLKDGVYIYTLKVNSGIVCSGRIVKN